MKKRFLLAPLAIGVAGASWAGTTLYSGSESREAYERLVSDLNGVMGFEVATTSYAAGFLASEAVTEVRASGAADAPVLFRLRHDIQHSPVSLDGTPSLSAARITTTLDADNAIDADIEAVLAGFGSATPLTLVSSVGFDGTVANSLGIAAYEFEDSDNGTRVSTGPAEWTVDFARDGSFTGAGHWDGATILLPDGTIRISGTEDSFDYRKIGRALYEGGYVLNLPEIGIDLPDRGLNMSLRQIALKTGSALKNDGYALDYSIAIADVDAPVPLDTVKVSGSVAGLATAGIEAATQEYFSTLASIIVPGASLGYEIALGNAGGEGTGSVRYEFEGDGSPGGYDLLGSPNATVGDLVRAMKATVKLDVDEAAIAITPLAMFVDPSMLAPWVISDGTSYTSNIVVDDLIVDINGQPMPLEAMMGEALATPLDLTSLLTLDEM